MFFRLKPKPATAGSSTTKNHKPRVLVFLPAYPEQAMIALGFIRIWKTAMPHVEFDALCLPAITSLARYCESLRLVMTFIESDQPIRRDMQQGGQLNAMQYFCAIVLSEKLHPQLTVSLGQIPWRIGWRGFFSRWLLSGRLYKNDWQGLLHEFSPELTFPQEVPLPDFKINKTESSSRMLWLGVDKHRTIVVACETPPDSNWQQAFIAARKQGYKLLGVGSAADTQWCDKLLPSAFASHTLEIMPSIQILAGDQIEHQMLAKSFAVRYCDLNLPAAKDWLASLDADVKD